MRPAHRRRRLHPAPHLTHDASPRRSARLHRPAPAPGPFFLRGLLADRIALVHQVIIPYQWEALNDRVEGAERSGCVQNVRIAAGEIEGKFHGHCFQDSDLSKWLEAASYRLATHPEPKLAAMIDGIIASLARAQRPDGYLNTYIQVSAPEQKLRQPARQSRAVLRRAP